MPRTRPLRRVSAADVLIAIALDLSDVGTDLRYAAMWNQAMLQSEDVHNALTSAMSKKKPTFAKL